MVDHTSLSIRLMKLKNGKIVPETFGEVAYHYMEGIFHAAQNENAFAWDAIAELANVCEPAHTPSCVHFDVQYACSDMLTAREKLLFQEIWNVAERIIDPTPTETSYQSNFFQKVKHVMQVGVDLNECALIYHDPCPSVVWSPESLAVLQRVTMDASPLPENLCDIFVSSVEYDPDTQMLRISRLFMEDAPEAF